MFPYVPCVLAPPRKINLQIGEWGTSLSASSVEGAYARHGCQGV